MLSDLAALIPPFLVCAAFLIAVGAFLRHEMGRAKNPGDDEQADGRSSHDYAEVSQAHSGTTDSENLAVPTDLASPTEAAGRGEPS